jgi:2-hydroxychromene-2-carboxylate isomerase
MWRDVERQAFRQGLAPLVRPDPFPQNGLLAARVAIVAENQPWQARFVAAVFDAEFARGLTIADPDVIARVLAALGQAPEPILARAVSDDRTKSRLREATDEARSKGIFGAPSFVAEDGELFWGNDRLEDAMAWARDTAT